MPLGGGGLVPNLLSGNIDATVLYSPLTYKMFLDKQARSLIDFGAAVPPNMTGAWMATDKLIKEKPQLLQKTLNALYGGLAFLQDGKNRAEAIKLIAEIDEIPPPIAEAELDGNIVKLSKDGAMEKDWMVRALDMASIPAGRSMARTSIPESNRWWVGIACDSRTSGPRLATRFSASG